MNKKYKLNKEWLDLMLENKNNTNLTFNLSDNDTRILLTYIEVLQQENARLKDKIEKVIEYANSDEFESVQQENTQLKDKFKDLEEWLEAMASMYENEYKDVDASEHYKCMLYKLK